MAMLEYCSLGNLKTFLVTKRKEAALLKKSSQFKKMAVDMAAGLCYLHSKSIAHKYVVNVAYLVGDHCIVES